MLMRVNFDGKKECRTNSRDDKPGKYDQYANDWERTLWEAYAYRNPTEDCDTKRAGPCKGPKIQNLKD